MVQHIDKIFGLQEFRINRIEIFKDEIYLYVQIKAKKGCCPRCRNWSKSIHQYHERKVRDLDIWGKKCYLIKKKTTATKVQGAEKGIASFTLTQIKKLGEINGTGTFI